MFHPKVIFRIVGVLLFFEAMFLLCSVPVAMYYSEPVEAILQIKLQKDKKDQVLRLVFGDNNIEILNK